MNIFVILRAVKDPAGLTVNRKAHKVFVNREEYIFNPSDRNALEAALRLAGQVTVAACGGAPAEQVLRDARAMGAERAYLLKDRTLERADAGALTLALSRLLDRIGGADLVLCGAECLDADLARAWPRLCTGRSSAPLTNSASARACLRRSPPTTAASACSQPICRPWPPSPWTATSRATRPASA